MEFHHRWVWRRIVDRPESDERAKNLRSGYPLADHGLLISATNCRLAHRCSSRDDDAHGIDAGTTRESLVQRAFQRWGA
jgi:hypothetical protein